MSKNTINKSDNFLNTIREYVATPYGKVVAGIASVALAGGGVVLANSISVKEDNVPNQIEALNIKNFYRYKMLENANSLKLHGACAQELNAESEYYKKTAQIVGPDYGIYEGNQPMDYKYLINNAKIYKRSAELAIKNEVSCFPANRKMSSLTPHFELDIMVNKRQCADKLESMSIEDVASKPTKLDQDLASAKNIKREIMIDLAKTQNISC